MQTPTVHNTPAPPPGILVADHFVQPHGYQVQRPQGTQDWLITYTVAGEGYYRLTDSQVICRPGDVVILEPGSPHHYATYRAEPWSFYWSHFWPRDQWREWLQLPGPIRGLRMITVAEQAVRTRLVHCWTQLLSDSHGVSPWQVALALNTLEEIVILLAQQQAQENRAIKDSRVERVLHYLNQHFHEEVTVELLAAEVALSPSRLAHLFKQETGNSIIATLLTIRLRHAARLLRFTSLEVQEIAQQVGFPSVFYFSRCFKSHYGQSPSAYRQQTTPAEI